MKTTPKVIEAAIDMFNFVSADFRRRFPERKCPDMWSQVTTETQQSYIAAAKWHLLQTGKESKR